MRAVIAHIKLRDTVTGAERWLSEPAEYSDVAAWRWTEGTCGCDCERASRFYDREYPGHVRLEDGSLDAWPCCVQKRDGGDLIEVVSVVIDGVEVVRDGVDLTSA